MSKGLTIPLSLDPRDWIQGIKVVERTLDGMEDDLDDVEDAAGTLGRKLEDAFDDARTSADKAGRSVDDVGDELGDVENEANQSAKEFGSAFRGDPVEALEEVQSYLAEIVSQKLPGFAGAAAAVAGGAALGLVVAGVEKWREKQERINEIATDYLGIIEEAAEGPLAATSAAYDDLIDKQLTLAVLEEASAAQLADLATLAAARGQTTQQYVEQLLSGELRTSEELGRLLAERQRLSDDILANTKDGNAANDDQIAILNAQDAALSDQGGALRSLGGFINENVAGYEKALAAQERLTAAIVASQEAQRGLNRITAERSAVPDGPYAPGYRPPALFGGVIP